MEAEKKALESKWKQWLKRMGVAGFLFFFLKGMVWLVLFFWAGKCALG
jgi:DMSO reductase anchor subunit